MTAAEQTAREELEEAVRELMSVEGDDVFAYERGGSRDALRRKEAWAEYELKLTNLITVIRGTL